MKKIILSLAIATSSYCSYAQTNTFPTPTGNVGIATTSSPIYHLQVNKTSSEPAMMIGGSYAGSPRLQIYGLEADPNAWMGLGTDMSGGPYEHSIYFPTAPSGYTGKLTLGDYNGNTYNARMTILNNGNVGIGTTNPGSNLTVRSNNTGVSIHTIGGGYFGTLAFNRESATGAIFNPSANAFQINNGNGTDKNLHIQVYSGSGSAVNPDALTIDGTTSGVGINTAYIPAGYQFAVNGNVISTSMTVKLRGNWPDYVFKPQYKLPSLTTVKAYIDQNQHLPDMPSEQEVKDNGINLGEIVKIQTKKIEELTLYLIEKDKQLTEQQKKNDENEARIAALEKALLKLTENQSK